MNFTAFNVKNRIATNAQNAKELAFTGKDKAVELATGIPVRIIEAFDKAFREGMAGFAHYFSVSTRAYKYGFGGLEATGGDLIDGLRANDPQTAMAATREALKHLLGGTVHIAIGNMTATPLAAIAEAGITLLSGTFTLAAVAEFAFPLLTVMAVGYAGLRLREVTLSTLSEGLERVFDDIQEDIDNSTTLDDLTNLVTDREDIEVVTIGIDDGDELSEDIEEDDDDDEPTVEAVKRTLTDSDDPDDDPDDDAE